MWDRPPRSVPAWVQGLPLIQSPTRDGGGISVRGPNAFLSLGSEGIKSKKSSPC